MQVNDFEKKNKETKDFAETNISTEQAFVALYDDNISPGWSEKIKSLRKTTQAQRREQKTRVIKVKEKVNKTRIGTDDTDRKIEKDKDSKLNQEGIQKETTLDPKVSIENSLKEVESNKEKNNAMQDIGASRHKEIKGKEDTTVNTLKDQTTAEIHRKDVPLSKEETDEELEQYYEENKSESSEDQEGSILLEVEETKKLERTREEQLERINTYPKQKT